METEGRYRVRPGGAPRGAVPIPGDKSVTHRALLLGALAEGETPIVGPNRGGDCLATAAALRALGVGIEETPGRFVVTGRVDRFEAPARPLDMGNSGTGARLLAGLLAGQPITATIDGDPSLRRRPMRRVTAPLRTMGASIEGRAGGDLLPLTIRGGVLRGITYRTPVASAQVKSAILLAGLRARGRTAVIEPGPSRDHTERMIDYLGGGVERRGLTASVDGGTLLRGARIDVGGDPSSAAFFVVAALVTPGGDVTARGILANRRRTAFLDVLERMGGRIERTPVETVGPEPRVDVRARESDLAGTEVAGDEIPRLIDEIPILAVAGACAAGALRVRDAAELRVKESDRIRKVVEMLAAFGRDVSEEEDGFTVTGGPLRGTRIASGGDHRIAMAATIAALAAAGETEVRGTGCIATSLPEFPAILDALGVGDRVVEER